VNARSQMGARDPIHGNATLRSYSTFAYVVPEPTAKLTCSGSKGLRLNISSLTYSLLDITGSHVRAMAKWPPFSSRGRWRIFKMPSRFWISIIGVVTEENKRFPYQARKLPHDSKSQWLKLTLGLKFSVKAHVPSRMESPLEMGAGRRSFRSGNSPLRAPHCSGPVFFFICNRATLACHTFVTPVRTG
jgi:hypothetical protein